MRNILSAALAMTLLLAAPAIAETELFSYRGGCAFALFLSTDPTECITTEITVSACDGRERYGSGGYETTPRLYMNMSRLDWCNSIELIQASGNAPIDFVKLSDALKGATARGSVEMYDSIQDILFDVEIDLAWTATGPISGRREHSFWSPPDSRFMSKDNDRSRDAEARGVISSDGINLLAGPSQEGYLLLGQGMEIRWPRM